MAHWFGHRAKKQNVFTDRVSQELQEKNRRRQGNTGLFGNFLNELGYNINPSNPRGLAGLGAGTLRQGIPEAYRTSKQAPGGFLNPTLVSGTQDTNFDTSSGENLRRGIAAGASFGDTTQNQQTTGGGDGGEEEIWKPRIWKGTLYTDQTQYEAVVARDLEIEYQRQFAIGGTAFENQLRDLTEQEEGLGIDFTNELGSLGRGRDEAQQSQGAFFSAISPEAVQSQQGVLFGRTQEEFARGETELGRQRTLGEEDIGRARTQSGLDRSNFEFQLEH